MVMIDKRKYEKRKSTEIKKRNKIMYDIVDRQAIFNKIKNKNIYIDPISGLKVLQFSYPRTGSTVIWYMLDYLLSNNKSISRDRWKNPLNVKKSHDIDIFKNFINNNSFDWCVTTIRDPYQAAVSVLRISKQGEDFNKKETLQKHKELIIDQLKKITKTYKVIYNNVKNPKCIIIDSKDIKNTEKILEMLEKKLSIDDIDKKELINKFSKATLKKVSGKYNKFGEYDNRTLIHGNHFNNKAFYPNIMKNNEIYKNALKCYKDIQQHVTTV